MQIVKIFPNNKNKCHFSIRKNLNKFYVYEGDMVLREDLENINSAETEISLICLARQQSFVKVVPVKYVSGVVQNTIEEYAVEIKNCKQCKKKFDVVKKRGSLNQAYCSPKCRTKFNNSKRIIKDKETRRSKGYGFVEMPNDAEGQAAIDALNGTRQHERDIVVAEAKGKRETDTNHSQPTAE